ncbi:unnamed protein product, partial [Amoebophrya sp. A25]
SDSDEDIDSSSKSAVYSASSSSSGELYDKNNKPKGRERRNGAGGLGGRGK